jgi:hypothetical protein
MTEQPAAAGGSQLQAHVWVRKPNIPMPWPGLILDRRRGRDGGWEALVTYVERMTVTPRVITEWVPYSWLSPGAQHPAGGTAYG